jgi:4,5-dihydroxyphthalate decarboxylase
MAERLQLSLGMSGNPRTRAILDGRIKPEGIEFVCTEVHASELFWRQLRFADFDVSEMSVSSYMMSVAAGDDRWVGIPVFTTRRMFQFRVRVRKDRGIEKPPDLKGKKMGVPEYQQTAALWTRGLLQHEYGVHPRDMEFWMERNDDHSQGSIVGFKPPKDVKVNYIPTSTNMGEMLLEGKLDGCLLYLAGTNNVVDRSSADIENHPDFKTLFPNPHAEGVRYYQKTGIYPINHGMVIKRSLAEKYPWALASIYNAFEQARVLAEKERMEASEYHLEIGKVPPESRAALASPIVRYGIEPNRKILETAAQYSYEQGLTPRLMKIEELFARAPGE